VCRTLPPTARVLVPTRTVNLVAGAPPSLLSVQLTVADP
jgi:hypothetical protein